MSAEQAHGGGTGSSSGSGGGLYCFGGSWHTDGGQQITERVAVAAVMFPAVNWPMTVLFSGQAGNVALDLTFQLGNSCAWFAMGVDLYVPSVHVAYDVCCLQ